ncbi:aspartate--tRNA(Asn) ligase [Clostridium sp. 'White wine YQ']|uniref:aspartate--tRNA(Asn) ligase n=1 Tax=Clostridium sp. 'White wine YQ' TaxID=3027474 RepID=UPI002365D471|nr:aspartate--tRNA(Asn) ligase [Clostridium sp. 'White wine YQ']MDD7796292.1 aspartate--tRNA(Asn) ligase [Clostridium sp. 'White wine YQ']
MKREMAKGLNEKIEERIMLKGWIHRIRTLKNITFIVLRDESGLVQCVAGKEISLDGVSNEAVVEVIGIVKEGKNSLNSYEISVESISVLNGVIGELPIEINKNELQVSLDTLLNNRVLSLRNENENSIFRVQHILVQAFRSFLSSEGFTEIFTPKIVAEGAEGGTALFKVDYFGEKAYLSQSPQFYKQMMIGAGYEKVFEIGNFFRAEEHDTSRHLNQFTSMDVEMAFIEDESTIMDLEQELLKFIMKELSEKGEKYIEALKIEIPIIEEIPRFELREVKEIIKDNYGKIINENDLDPEGERLISKYIKEKFNSDFVFITNYGRECRPMYTMPKGENGTKAFDLIFRGVELTSGAQRIHEYNMLVQNFKDKGLNPDDFNSYIETFKYGMPPHGGFAIGLERFMALLLGIENVRKTSLFPRDRHRLVP